MKEKFDVSLDNRQIVSLLIAGIVVMGAVFVLGVVVGKKLAGNAEAAAAPDLLSALDASAQVLQEAQQEPPLTFQDELTRKSAAAAPEPKPAAKPAAAKPTPAPAAAAAAPAPAPKPAPAAAAPAAAEKPAEKPATAEKPETAFSAADEELAALAAVKRPQAPSAAPAEKPAEKPAAAAATKPASAVAAPVPTAKPAVADETVATRTATPAGGGLKEAIARATQRPTEAAPGGAFTLQLSAFQTREEADRFAGRLRDRGYAPYIVAAEVANKGTWYRVRMGSFPTKDAATRYLTDFKRETQLDAFVAGTN